MPASTFIGHFLGPDTHANRPAATGLANGTLYVCSTHNKIERVVSGAWVDYANLASGAAATTVATDPIYDVKGDLPVGTGADTAARLAVGADGQVLTADSAQSTGVKWAAAATGSAGALTLISTTTLASAGPFDISGISGSYNDLILVLIARGTDSGGADNVALRFNGDTTAKYHRVWVQGVSSAASANQAIGANNIQMAQLPAGTAPAGQFGVMEITLYGYASTTWRKALHYRSHLPGITSGLPGVWMGGALWDNTAAITRVEMFGVFTANLVAGSQLRIYGRT